MNHTLYLLWCLTSSTKNNCNIFSQLYPVVDKFIQCVLYAVFKPHLANVLNPKPELAPFDLIFSCIAVLMVWILLKVQHCFHLKNIIKSKRKNEAYIWSQTKLHKREQKGHLIHCIETLTASQFSFKQKPVQGIIITSLSGSLATIEIETCLRILKTWNVFKQWTASGFQSCQYILTHRLLQTQVMLAAQESHTSTQHHTVGLDKSSGPCKVKLKQFWSYGKEWTHITKLSTWGF